MKLVILMSLFTLIFSNIAFAGETTTECPMMKELNERNNPKAAGSLVKAKTRPRGSSSTKQ